MKKTIALLIVAAFSMTAPIISEAKEIEKAGDDASYQGKPLNYWIEVIRNRDEQALSKAFDAIQSLGPKASAAVPELIRIVEAPFTAITMDEDSEVVVAEKLYDLEVRSVAIDSLRAIGEAAAPATIPLIKWALRLRVIPGDLHSTEKAEQFVALVTLEVEYRIRVIDTIGRFGDAAIPALFKLLKSSEAEQRKLAVIILGADVLRVTELLLNSRDCEDQQLGLTILRDMEPLAAKLYLKHLQQTVACYAN